MYLEISLSLKKVEFEYNPFKRIKKMYIQDKVFEQNDRLEKGKYENCVFNNCDFSNSNFSGIKFTDCTFQNSNLSLIKLDDSSFQEVKFVECKMLGLRFDTCTGFGISFSFEGCQLNHSSFYKIKLKKTLFKDSQLQETDFVEADLTHAVFDNCDLIQTVFDRTILEKADFRTSYNYSINPETNRIKKAKFSVLGLSGLLDKYDIVIEG